MWRVSVSPAKRLIQAVVGDICIKTCSEVIIILVQYGELMSALFDFCYRSILTFLDDSEGFSTKVESAIIKQVFAEQISHRTEQNIYSICAFFSPHLHVAPRIWNRLGAVAEFWAFYQLI